MTPPTPQALPPPATGRRDRLFPLKPHQRRPAALIFVAALGLTGALESLVTVGPLSGLERQATDYLDTSGRKATEAFAAARAINATVSVLKSADLSAFVAQVAPMEVLEPVDDLAKQFSDVMVVSIVSIFLQDLLLKVSHAWALGILLPVACLLLATTYHFKMPPPTAARLAVIGRGILVVALFGRFAVPIAGVVGASITDHYLAGDLTQSMTVMHDSGESLLHVTNQIAPAATPAEPAPPSNNEAAPGVVDRVENALRSQLAKGKAYVDTARNWLPDKAALEALIANLPGHIVRAIEIFLVQTIVTPLAVAYLLYVLLRQVVRPAPEPRVRRSEDRLLALTSAVPAAAE